MNRQLNRRYNSTRDSMYLYELDRVMPPTIYNNTPPDGNRGGGITGGAMTREEQRNAALTLGRLQRKLNTIQKFDGMDEEKQVLAEQINMARRLLADDKIERDANRPVRPVRVKAPKPVYVPTGRPRGRPVRPGAPRKAFVPLQEDDGNYYEREVIPNAQMVPYSPPQPVRARPTRAPGVPPPGIRQKVPRAQGRPIRTPRPIRVNKRAGKTMLSITKTLIDKLRAYSDVIHTIKTQNEPLFKHIEIINNEILPALSNVQQQMIADLSF